MVDKMEKKEHVVRHMIADYSTNPTQGHLFLCQRNAMLGLKKEDFSECELWYKDVFKEI